MRRIWLAVCLVVPLPAVADDFKPERVAIVGRVGESAWTDAATEARADQKAELAVVVVGKRGRKRVVLAPDGVATVVVSGSRLATEKLATARVQWSTVEPHGFRTTPAKNGVTTEFYSNVSQEPGSFGKWLGFDTIEYFERIVAPWGAPAVIPAAITSEPGIQQVHGIGTVHYKVEVELAGVHHLVTPGAQATDTQGLRPIVHRVSIRRGDDFLGRLSSYLLVPEVFGSAGGGRDHQTERYTGADCADVMVGAARRMGRPFAYTNVEGLTAYATTISRTVDLDEHGTPARTITGVKPGDLIRIDYGGALRGHTPRGWDHVAALWEDRSDPDGPHKGAADGQLDGFDLVIHMGHPRLEIEPLSEQSPSTIDVLRFR